MTPTSLLERAEAAALNNAAWCDTVCRAHGSPGDFLDGLWVHRRPSPRFYPNAVTLSPEGAEAQTEAIPDLQRSLPGEWAVKDSFSRLDLAPLGFRPLFEAMWIWRDVALPPPEVPVTGAEWIRVTGKADLEEWELAWSGPPPEDVPLIPRIFLPPLLSEDTISILAAYREGRVVAGGIANRTGEVVGVSNLFAHDLDPLALKAGCIATIIRQFSGLPLVGYEAGSDLEDARRFGFEEMGPLRVWVNSDSAR